MHHHHLFSILLLGVSTPLALAARKTVLKPEDVPATCTELCKFAVDQTTTCEANNRGKTDFLLCVCGAPNAVQLLQQCSACLATGTAPAPPNEAQPTSAPGGTTPPPPAEAVPVPAARRGLLRDVRRAMNGDAGEGGMFKKRANRKTSLDKLIEQCSVNQGQVPIGGVPAVTIPPTAAVPSLRPVGPGAGLPIPVAGSPPVGTGPGAGVPLGPGGPNRGPAGGPNGGVEPGAPPQGAVPAAPGASGAPGAPAPPAGGAASPPPAGGTPPAPGAGGPVPTPPAGAPAPGAPPAPGTPGTPPKPGTPPAGPSGALPPAAPGTPVAPGTPAAPGSPPGSSSGIPGGSPGAPGAQPAGPGGAAPDTSPTPPVAVAGARGSYVSLVMAVAVGVLAV